MVLIKTVEFLLPENEIVFLEADKGCDSKNLRFQLLVEGIYPLIPYRGARGLVLLNGLNESVGKLKEPFVG